MTLSSEDRDGWLARWRDGRTRFHLDRVNPVLVQYVNQLPPNGRLFVPLCGKSLDLGWLVRQGYEVVGVELVKKAVSELFEALDCRPTLSTRGSFESWKTDGLEVLIGDIFELDTDLIGLFDVVWDRAALIALNQTDRARYAPHVTGFVRPGGRTLLSALVYDQQQMKGPPFSVSISEVRQLYESSQSLVKVEEKDVTTRNPLFIEAGLDQVIEHVWLIS